MLGKYRIVRLFSVYWIIKLLRTSRQKPQTPSWSRKPPPYSNSFRLAENLKTKDSTTLCSKFLFAVGTVSSFPSRIFLTDLFRAFCDIPTMNNPPPALTVLPPDYLLRLLTESEMETETFIRSIGLVCSKQSKCLLFLVGSYWLFYQLRQHWLH